MDATETLPRGTALDRYVVLEPIGFGGMGTVYRAHDPRLRREIAIKVIRVHSRDAAVRGTARARLLREAQTMAQLNHPNVLPVFDVGYRDGHLFVAMELVDGLDLRHWLDLEPRSLASILAVFTDAARGLVAAHAAGVVHRDFKPGNVLVDRGEPPRVRVTDFGLARFALTDEAAITSDPGSVSEPLGVAALVDLQLTDHGVVIGTPPYMAPEQQLGHAADFRADQYSFAVALWEGVYGTRPFANDTPEAVLDAKLKGAPPAPTSRAVPRWLHAVFERALAPDPARRFMTMNAVVEALDRGARRRWWPVGVVAVATAVAVTAVVARGADELGRCETAPLTLDTLWNDASRETVAAAMSVQQVPYAADAREHVIEGLDRWAQGWTSAATEVCAATVPRNPEAANVRDRQVACLHRQRESFAALIGVLTDEPGVARRAVDAVAGLPDIAGCRDEVALRAEVEPPRGIDTARAVGEVRVLLARAAALHAAGRYDDAMVLARQARLEAESIDYAPLRARAHAVLGSVALRAGDGVLAREAMQSAFFMASAAGDAETAAEAALQSITLAGMADDPDAARQWAEHAQAQIVRMGSPARLESERLANLAHADWLEQRFADGLARLEQAHALAEGVVLADDPARASLENQLALFLDALGRHDEALAHLQRALAVRIAAVGDDHPDVANLRLNLGMHLRTAGDLAGAREQIERAVAIQRETLRPNHPYLAISLADLSIVLAEQGELARAEQLQRESLEIRVAELGPQHSDVAESWFNLGGIAREQGRPDVAVEHLAAALAILEQHVGADSPQLVDVLLALGGAARERGELDEARRHHRRAEVIAVGSSQEVRTAVAQELASDEQAVAAGR